MSDDDEQLLRGQVKDDIISGELPPCAPFPDM